MSGALVLVVGALVLLGVLAVVLYSRVRTLARRVGSFECALRRPGSEDWTSGIAGYGVNRVDWHRLVSLAPWPATSWSRDRLQLLAHTGRDGNAGTVVEVRCRHGGEEFELAMVRGAFAGLVSWLEAAPPGEEPLR
ncbi:DUF2550 domain-containing protein [Georgenia sp. 10Sc9-8]|uniref:DUF2550 domain-containing protein n=1 Tax=Georgenia halotolerans TaxID=3028317 RepID=A0ABT5U1P3_9MICO|nr:DUF2550 domain-containing protein [Georgenia halotolerans]